MPTRPSSLGVCGILLIIFGALGLIGLISSVMMVSGGWNLPGAERNPALAAMKLPGYLFFMKVMIVPTLLGSLLGIVAGAGLLKGHEWARKGGLLWAVVKIISGLAGVWASFAFVVPMIAKMTLPPGMKPEQAEIFRATMHAAMTGGMVMAAVFAVALPVVLMVLLTRPRLAEYCKRTAPSIPPPLHG